MPKWYSIKQSIRVTKFCTVVVVYFLNYYVIIKKLQNKLYFVVLLNTHLQIIHRDDK